ncbi:hypothetical protein T484DRAFT_1824670 [Baffinella frigidus]|nr:hypothetical protein T484DRAFT_1824670 [Cryptophyta sp. CCMP2293]
MRFLSHLSALALLSAMVLLADPSPATTSPNQAAGHPGLGLALRGGMEEDAMDESGDGDEDYEVPPLQIGDEDVGDRNIMEQDILTPNT